jgi:hypothetical protein
MISAFINRVKDGFHNQICRILIMKARPAYFNSIISGAESDLELISFSLQMAETLK